MLADLRSYCNLVSVKTHIYLIMLLNWYSYVTTDHTYIGPNDVVTELIKPTLGDQGFESWVEVNACS